MPQVLIRELEERTVTRLKQRAKQHGRSFEAELRTILNDTVKDEPRDPAEVAAEIRTMFAGRTFDDSAELIRADRDR
jgi:plasmid stability protein